jgi:hypothetical protein
VQAQTTYRAVSGNMNFTYGHGCILNEKAAHRDGHSEENDKVFRNFLLLFSVIFSVQ